jgi:hypothetical protein
MQSPAGARSSQLVMFFALLNPPHGSSFVFLSLASVPPAKAKNPTAAVLGSPANSLGSPLSSFLLPAHKSTT